ncbi:MAG: hypothetical protein QOE63_263 [Acidimicrobiaceae bacterium]
MIAAQTGQNEPGADAPRASGTSPTLRAVASPDQADDERDWLSELSTSSWIDSPAGSVPASPGGEEPSGPPPTGGRSVVSEIAALRAEVAALCSAVAEPPDDGSRMVTASALVELQAEVGQLRESIAGLEARSADAERGVGANHDQLVALAEHLSAAADEPVPDLTGPLREALAEHESKMVGALMQVAGDLAELRRALLGS